MAFRVVFIESETNIHIKLDNLILNKGEGDIWIPVSDISVIILDNLKITLTTRMMSALAEENVGIIICNKEHLPIGFYSSYDNHSRVSKCIGYQIEKESVFYDEIWKQIVQVKIKNQQKVLEKLNMDKKAILKLDELADEVELGDPTNREAHAAKLYFQTMMGKSYSRGNEDILLNSGLDYGYAVLRAFIARTCVGYGLNTQIGIHHRNEFNRFNLVDDLIEVFRPYVDYIAYKELQNQKYFTRENRIALIRVLNNMVRYKNQKMIFSNVIEEFVEQYAAYIQKPEKKQMIYPLFDGFLGDEDEI